MMRAASHVFDLDGTLSDPSVGIARSLDHALAWFGYASLPDGGVTRFIGPPLDQVFRTIVGPVGDARIVDLMAKYRERYADVGYAENVMYAGIAEALSELSNGGVLGVCTSKRADFAERILRRFGIRERFAFVSGGDIGVTKADQLADLVREGCADESSIMIGDRAVDIAGAKANGLVSAGVLWGFGSADELMAAEPKFLVASPAELAEVLS
jgi:phosphoglycolate phosphatase